MIKITLNILIGILFVFSYGFSSDKIAIKAGNVITVSGENIKNGIILISGSKIEKIGKGLKIPGNYKVYDYSNKNIYPGLINAKTSLGLSDIASIKQSTDLFEPGKFNPEVSYYTAFYSWSRLIANSRDFGTTIALSAPSGGRISGKAVLVNLNGWTPEDMFIKKEAALILNFPGSKVGKKNKKKTKGLSKESKELMNFIKSAFNYYKNFKEKSSLEFNPKYEAMKALWIEKMPVIISVSKAKDIKTAIKMSKDYSLNSILYGIYDGESVLSEIKKSGYPVILSTLYQANQKWDDGYDKVYRLPAALYKTGIKFAFSMSYSPVAFDLPIQASRAVAFGLPQKEALKALTIYPAEIFGLEGYGSIEEGKIADLIIADGNILETSTRIVDVFIHGKLIKDKSYFRKEYFKSKKKISGETR